MDEGYRGVVLEGTGLGHVNTRLYGSIERAVREGLYLGMTSQCIWGRVDMDVYTTGRELQQIGVQPLGDMLPETALVKLMWTLGYAEDADAAREVMGRNVAGAYSDRTLYAWRHV
jgi:glutamyl-tRNA(Gln) amidotransferase subunit D